MQMKLSQLSKQRLHKISNCGIEIYRIDLENIEFEECSCFFKTLNMEEQCRASRMLYSASQKFIVCRAICKQIIGEKLNIENINFDYLTHGKPYIKNCENFFFNISHSNNIGIIGISEKSSIGVDIEFVDNGCKFKELMDEFMFSHEKRWVLETESIYRFFMLWTMKEAILKQSGEGISSNGFPPIKIRKNVGWYNEREIKTFFIEGKKYVISTYK